MRFYYVYCILGLILFINQPELVVGQDEITGLYVSKEPTFNDKMNIMYSKALFNFLYIGSNDENLELKSDNTFIRTFNACKEGKVSDTGTWKKYDGKIILDFDTEGYEDQAFTLYKGNKLYYVGKFEVMDSEDVMPHLTLLEKQ